MGSGDEETLESYGTEMDRQSNLGAIEWLLVEGDRLLVTSGITATILLGLFGLHFLGIVELLNDDSVTRIASGMVAGTFSLVTLVVSINQMILSREFRSADDYRDQLGGVMEFREDIESIAKVPATPAAPAALLRVIVSAIDERAEELDESVADHPDNERRDLVSQYVASIHQSTERIHETLEETSFGTFTALSAAINYNDAWQIYAGRHIYYRHQDDFSEGTTDAFERLIDALQLFNTARAHFKTTYLQRELTQFSRQTLYCGVPAVLSAIGLGLIYADLGGPTLSTDLVPFVAIVLITAAVSPLALLTAYILRTATVTHRTASIGPMLPQKDPEEGPFDVSYGENRE